MYHRYIIFGYLCIKSRALWPLQASLADGTVETSQGTVRETASI